jgi:hypothetical protein
MQRENIYILSDLTRITVGLSASKITGMITTVTTSTILGRGQRYRNGHSQIKLPFGKMAQCMGHALQSSIDEATVFNVM